MFYDAGSGWSISSYPGSWMIRPLLSREKIILDVKDNSIKFKVYPNPVRSELFIETSSSNNIISIYSLQGRLISEVISKSNIIKINFNDLSSGVYIVELLNEETKKYQKIIVR